MRLTAEIYYPGIHPVAVFTMLTDRAFQERKCAATGSLAYEVDLELFEDGGASITTHRTLPTDQIPEFVRRFVGGSVRVVERHDWQGLSDDGTRQGTLVVEITGAPVHMTCDIRLIADDEGTVHEVDGDLKSSVPLIGGKIEKAVEPAIRAAMRVEERTGRAWLSGDPD
jgi:hypothetical protein